MAKSLEELLTRRPVDIVAVGAHKKHLLDEVRAYRVRELREASDLTQVELAARLHVSQNRCPGSSTATLTAPRSTRCESMLKRSVAGFVSRLNSATNGSRSPDPATRS